MAIAHGSASFATGSADNPVGTEPASTVSGNLLIAVVVHENSANAITEPAGWSTLFTGGSPSAGAAGFRYWIGWIIRGGSAPALTWTSTGAVYYEVIIERLTGSFDAGSIDASANGTLAGSGSSSMDPPSATATGTADMAVAAAIHWAGAGAGGYGAPAGYTVRSRNTAGDDAVFATKLLSASGAENPAAITNAAGSGADYWNGATLLIKEASGGGTDATVTAVPMDATGDLINATVASPDATVTAVPMDSTGDLVAAVITTPDATVIAVLMDATGDLQGDIPMSSEIVVPAIISLGDMPAAVVSSAAGDAAVVAVPLDSIGDAVAPSLVAGAVVASVPMVALGDVPAPVVFSPGGFVAGQGFATVVARDLHAHIIPHAERLAVIKGRAEGAAVKPNSKSAKAVPGDRSARIM